MAADPVCWSLAWTDYVVVTVEVQLKEEKPPVAERWRLEMVDDTSMEKFLKITAWC